MSDIRDLTNEQLVLMIRQYETSPAVHRTFKMRERAERYLAELRAEATRRGLFV
jgi:hypothetical protein